MKFRIKLSSLDELHKFVEIATKYNIDINYKIGSIVFDAKSIVSVVSSYGNEAVVELITDDKTIINCFKSEIAAWIVGE